MKFQENKNVRNYIDNLSPLGYTLFKGVTMENLQDVQDNYNSLLNYLKEGFSEVDGSIFYHEIFPDNQSSGFESEDYIPNAIYLYSNPNPDSNRKMNRRIMLSDTWSNDYKEYVQNNDFALCSGLAYRGRANRLENAQKLYTLVFDLDNVTVNELKNLFLRMGQEPSYRTLPQATYIVLSGTGLHIYYVLDKPIDLYPNIKLQMKSLKYDLTSRIWDYKGTTLEKNIQYQSISQGYRMVGSNNHKYGLKVRAFRVGSSVSLATLNRYTNEDKNKVDLNKPFKPSMYSKPEAKEKFPEWYEKVILNNDKTKKKWNVNPAVYKWWLRQINEVKGGHRYYFLMCMSVYAVKCNIPKKQLKEDMVKVFNELSKISHSNNLSEDDLVSALEAYDRGYFNFTIDDIVKLTDITIKKNVRHYQKQSHHLEEIRAKRDVKQKRNGTNWYDNGGRPFKNGVSKEMVIKGIEENSHLKVAELVELLNVSRTTIYKYRKK